MVHRCICGCSWEPGYLAWTPGCSAWGPAGDGPAVWPCWSPRGCFVAVEPREDSKLTANRQQNDSKWRSTRISLAARERAMSQCSHARLPQAGQQDAGACIAAVHAWCFPHPLLTPPDSQLTLLICLISFPGPYGGWLSQHGIL